MAATGEKFRPMEVFWTRDESDDDAGPLPLTGRSHSRKNAIGNQRPPKLKSVKGKKTPEVKASIPKKQPVIQTLSAPVSLPDQNVSGKPSLKDLCREDKQRIANLIKELARLGEEKESVRGQLDQERKQFESELQRVIKQQERILRERHTVQGQLEECQSSLGRYQRLAEEQTKQATLAKQTAAAAVATAADVTTKAKEKQQKDTAGSRCKAELYTPPSQRKNINQTERRTDELPSHQPAEPSPRSSRLSLTGDLNKSLHERPFTHLIDKLIEDEKCKTDSDPAAATSGYEAGNSASEFRPLVPDVDSERAEESSSQEINGHGNNFADKPMSDEQFVQYYKKLSPFERKRQLQVQKQALLEEQTYLKSLLVQQEKLLQAKQDQLNMQHELQQGRLKYFERTGKFPPHDPRIQLPFLEREPFLGQEQQMDLQQQPQQHHHHQQQHHHPQQHHNQQQHHHQQQQLQHQYAQNMEWIENQKQINEWNRRNQGWSQQYPNNSGPSDQMWNSQQNGNSALNRTWTESDVPNTPTDGPFPPTPSQSHGKSGLPKPVFYPKQDDIPHIPAAVPANPHAFNGREQRPAEYRDHYGPFDDEAQEEEEVLSQQFSDARASDLLDLVEEVESQHNTSHSEKGTRGPPYHSKHRGTHEPPYQSGRHPNQNNPRNDAVDPPYVDSYRSADTRRPRKHDNHNSRKVPGAPYSSREADVLLSVAKDRELMQRQKAVGTRQRREFSDRDEFSEVTEDDLEESQVLEEVFFVK